MIKKSLLISVIVASAGALSQPSANVEVAQRAWPAREPRIVRRVIPQAQMILSTYQTSGNSKFVARQGWGAGALVDIGNLANLVLESGVLYRELNGTSRDVSGSANYSFGYLSVPFAAKFYFTGQDDTSFYAKAGVMASALTTSSVAYSPSYSGSPRAIQSRSFEFSVLFGVGLKYILSPVTEIYAEGNYLRPIDAIFQNQSGLTTAWSLGAGVGFNLL